MDDILNYDLIICENSYKMAILEYATNNHLLLNAKIMSKEKFFQEYFFTYDKRALSYLVQKYQVKVSIAQMYLENLYFIEDKEYKKDKLKFLKNIKDELSGEGLLKTNVYFHDYLKNKKILVLGYLVLEKWEQEIFNQYKTFYFKFNSLKNIKTVYEFSSIEEEIEYVAESIGNLISKGIPLNKIKLMNVSENYYEELERIFKIYNIPVKIPSLVNLLGLEITSQFLSYLQDNSLKDALNLINEEDEEIGREIIRIGEKYLNVPKDANLISLIKEDLKKASLSSFDLANYVSLIKIDDYVSSDEHVFLMNFNASSIPSYKKDEDYITDNLKEEVSLYKTYEYNKILKDQVMEKIKMINNLVITYKLNDSLNIYYPSSLVSLLNLKVMHPKRENIHYSYLHDKLKYTTLLDNYAKYGTISEELKIYQNNIKDLDYKTYNHKFKGILNNHLKDYLKSGLTLSYSSLDNYNKCAFRYYLDNILKLNPFSETFETFIGSLFHDVLEKCLNNNSDVKEEINNYLRLKEKIPTSKEKFYLNKLEGDLKFVLDYLKEEKKYISLDKEYHEKYIVIKKEEDIPVKFVGFVDKILYKEEPSKTLVAITDYKTGLVDINLNYVPYGLSLQLPIYLYLVSKSGLFKNPLYAGFYLQHILDKDLKRSDDYVTERKNSLKLRGYSNSDLSILKYLDSSLSNSAIIKGLKLKNDGNFAQTSKVLNNKEIEKLISLTEKIIDKSIKSIIAGDFPISPKKIGYEKDIGCLYCPFKDICYKDESDDVILEDIKDLTFLGGD